MAANYFLKLDRFEGPLDLLLHLIKVNEIDIFNIDIFLLTTQYLEHLRLIKFDDLQQAGEFVEMASSLVEMKTRYLLPSEEQEAADDDGHEDPLRSLQERLVEYELFKKSADLLAQMPQLGVDIQTNSEWKRLESTYEDVEAPLSGDASTLVVMYEQLLKTMPDRRAVRVEAQTHALSIDEKIDELAAMLEKLKFALFQGFYKKFKSRYEWVVYITAMLEMVRWRKMKVYQREALGPIWMYHMELNPSELPLSAEEKRKLLENHVPVAPANSVEQAAQELN